MTVVSALSGQTALVSLPTQKVFKNGTSSTMSSPGIPVQLKLSKTSTKKGTGSGVLGNGMDVIKVAEVSGFDYIILSFRNHYFSLSKLNLTNLYIVAIYRMEKDNLVVLQ